MKKRLLSFDIFRILIVFIVFCFHAKLNMNTEFGILADFFAIGNFAMIPFFVLSGALLYISSSHKDLHNIDGIKRFYIRRLSVIMPGYLLLYIVWSIFLDNITTPINKVWSAPPQLLGIQSVYHNGQGYYPQNPGTWFISCILICYLIYPYLQEITKQMKLKTKVILLLVFYVILAYSPIMCYHFSIESIYSNAFFAILQFYMGVLITSLSEDVKVPKVLSNWIAFVLEWLVLVAVTTLAVGFVGIRDNSTIYNIVIIPIVCLIVYTALGIKTNTRSKVTVFISDISFEVYLVQCVSLPWYVAQYVSKVLGLTGSMICFAISIVAGVIGAIILHYVNKGMGLLLKKACN